MEVPYTALATRLRQAIRKAVSQQSWVDSVFPNEVDETVDDVVEAINRVIQEERAKSEKSL